MLLLLDFDGTLTDRDTLDLLVAEHAPAIWAEAERALTAGTMTLYEVIAFEFEHVHSTLDAALAMLRSRVALRPGLPELITFCRERFIDPVVISSGFHELIEPVLAWGGVRLPVVAHSATFSTAGTAVAFLERPTCPVCGEQCKRMELERLSGGRQIATSATAGRIAARRRPPTSCSLAPRWRSTWPTRASPTCRSRT